MSDSTKCSDWLYTRYQENLLFSLGRACMHREEAKTCVSSFAAAASSSPAPSPIVFVSCRLAGLRPRPRPHLPLRPLASPTALCAFVLLLLVVVVAVVVVVVVLLEIAAAPNLVGDSASDRLQSSALPVSLLHSTVQLYGPSHSSLRPSGFSVPHGLVLHQLQQ